MTGLQRKTPLKAKAPLKQGAAMKRGPMKSTRKPTSSKIRKSANGQPCLVRAEGVCNGDNNTVVLAHLNGAGTGAKAADHEGAYACCACHWWLDGGYVQCGHSRDTRDLWHLQAILRTQRELIDQGFITIQGAA